LNRGNALPVDSRVYRRGDTVLINEHELDGSRWIDAGLIVLESGRSSELFTAIRLAMLFPESKDTSPEAQRQLFIDFGEGRQLSLFDLRNGHFDAWPLYHGKVIGIHSGTSAATVVVRLQDGLHRIEEVGPNFGIKKRLRCMSDLIDAKLPYYPLAKFKSYQDVQDEVRKCQERTGIISQVAVFACFGFEQCAILAEGLASGRGAFILNSEQLYRQVANDWEIFSSRVKNALGLAPTKQAAELSSGLDEIRSLLELNSVKSMAEECGGLLEAAAGPEVYIADKEVWEIRSLD
jgi:hypothetical protein